MIPLAVIRPQPGCDATVAAARALGLDARGFPLFAVSAIAWEPLAADSFDALLLGSANAPRHAGAALAAYAGKPAYTVGATTAEAARAAGLDVVASGVGGIKALLPLVRPEHRRLLRLSGRERMVLSPPRGVSIIERVVYASEPLPMSPALRQVLAAPAVVALHSAEAAQHLAALCDDHRLERGRIALATIGPRVSRAAGTGWAAIATAAVPNDTALLALAQDLCQTPAAERNCGPDAG
ncbi:uroporphyrinogen-III synthase [Novosphingobium sp. JCM 18896]|uniref:uroporphyrinogen-III synthase n=1 Tax=Novosphingobium sp. JCM 18896 TaxID=2989731 RepID=UPI002221BFD5|nr:uroporphyrinogen-III synthase [Novosphingobium sp. JCM 18896]MCW1428815.1 uroporphyrinogen-III synthase [Novosphingobium sp. JCM 18896]